MEFKNQWDTDDEHKSKQEDTSVPTKEGTSIDLENETKNTDEPNERVDMAPSSPTIDLEKQRLLPAATPKQPPAKTNLRHCTQVQRRRRSPAE